MLSESVVAPATFGSWSLQVSVYVLADGAVVGPSSQEIFGLNVVPYTATSTMVTTQSIIEVTSATSSSAQSTITPTTLAQLQSISTENQPAGELNGGVENEMLLVAALFIVVIIIVAMLVQRKRQEAREEQTRMY
jgi:hypothetical protein